MKKIIFGCIATISIVLFSCDTKTEPTINTKGLDANFISNPTTVEYIDTTVDIGKINEGDKVPCEFKIKNIGKNDLVLLKVTPGCGCTLVDYPKEPIKSGNIVTIKAEFNSKGKQGVVDKAVIVESNTIPTTKFLRIKGEIKED